MGKKKNDALATGYITIEPSFDGFDEATDELAKKIEARISQAVAEGIAAGIRKALPTTRPTVYRGGGMLDGVGTFDGRGVN